ncbi:MAG: type II toxin-antitoxin system HicA family toxin [Oscillospiraceae bacterium]|jgi:predicted RNA binding protein YcfA (HicA-like mRNA interferase family)|nr:type II toxin-antitoxin system HicA family toxin [Oscillospiraceae bacterium]
MNKKKLFVRIVNNQKNVQFNDFVTVIEAFGFSCVRRGGSHQIYNHPNIAELINVQDENGKGKPYQIKQFLSLVEKYKMNMEDEI